MSRGAARAAVAVATLVVTVAAIGAASGGVGYAAAATGAVHGSSDALGGGATVAAAGAPVITDFSVTNPSGSTIEVRFNSSEPIDDVLVGIDRESSLEDTLDRTDFTESGSGPYTYVATYTAATDGNYTAELSQALDADGNNGAGDGSYVAATTVDTAAPTMTGVSLTDATDANGVVADGDGVAVEATVDDATSNVSSVTANLTAFGAGTVNLTDDDGDGTYDTTVAVDEAAASADGTYAVTVNATDDATPANQNTTTTGTLELDTTPPALSSPVLENATSPGDPVGNGSDVLVAVDATDARTAVDTVTADLSAFGAGTVTLTDGDADGTYDTTVEVDEAAADPDGDYAVTLTATDEVGNVNTTTTPQLELDTAPGITAYAATVATGQNVTISFQSDEQLGTIVVELTGDTTATLTESDFSETGSGPYDYEATVYIGTDGTVTATLTTAADASGTDGAAGQSADATVDTTPPVVGPILLNDADDADGVVADDDGVRVAVTPTDATSTIDTVTADLSAFGAGTVNLTDGDGDGTYDRTVAVDEAGVGADGTASATVTVTDSRSQTNTTSGGTLTVDTTAPSVSTVTVVDGDGDGSVVDGEDVTVTATATDDTATVVSVTADLSPLGAGQLTLTDGDGDGVYEATTQAGPGGVEGSSTVVVEAADDPDNRGTNSTAGPVYDAGAPTVTPEPLSDETDANGAVGDGDVVRIAASVTDAAGVDTVTANASAFGAGIVQLTYNSSGDVWDGTVTVDRTTAFDDGDYPVSVNATDVEGQSVVVDTTTLSLDSTPPSVSSVSLTDAADGDTVVADGGTVRIVADVTDAGGVATVEANLTAFGVGPGNVSLSYNSSLGAYEATGVVDADASGAAGAGAHDVVVTAVDGETNEASAASNTVTVDTAAPSVDTVTVADGDADGRVTDDESVTVTATVTDSGTGVSTVEVDLSALGVGPGNTTLTHQSGDTYEATVTVDAAGAGSDGTVAVAVVGVDAAGIATTNGSASLALDTTDPALSSLSVTDATDGDGVVVDGDVVRVVATATDATAVQMVEADLSAFGVGPGNTTLTYNSSLGAYDATGVVDAGATTDGDYGVAVKATDAEELAASAESPSTVRLDSTAPSLTNVNLVDDADGDGVVSDGDALRVEATVTDATAVVDPTVNLSAFGAGDVALVHQSGDTYAATAPVDRAAAAGQGSHDATVTVDDGLGHTATATTGSLTVDTPPTVEAFDLTAAGDTELVVTLRASEQLDALTVEVDGPNETTLALGDFGETSHGNGSYTYDASWTPAATGDYAATVTVAADANGKDGADGQLAAASTTTNGSGSDGDGGESVTTETVVVTREVEVNATDDDDSTADDGEDGPAVRVEATSNATATVRIEDAAPNEPVTAVLESETNDSSLVVRGLETTANATSYDLGVSVTTDPPASLSTAGDGDEDGEPAPTVPSDDVLGYVTVDHSVPDDQIDYAMFSFELPAERLDERGVDPGELRLFRLHDGAWQSLETVHVATRDGVHEFRAVSPGFSVFAVGRADAGRPSVVATSLDRTHVVGTGDVGVSVTLRNDRETPATRTVELSLGGDLVETRTVVVAGNATRTVWFQRRVNASAPGAPERLRVAVDNQSVGTVRLSTESTPTASPTTLPTTAAATATDAPSADGQSTTALPFALPFGSRGSGAAVVVGVAAALFAAARRLRTR
ncbi:PGF-pre-PGF domain-containing protein [Halobaculum marinum]|uniref:PGF-pre-PGF domain-containing protein n=1 Tax=Halobaculum marinum TaxID=3031996 RepID=A0ABD5WXP5_9EURY|nr:PGF-pre-PGF domain-containing protein [Halobaculum sp. DT55]